MSKVCPISGKRPVSGNNVSHSQRHTKRRWEPNLVSVTLVDSRGRKVRMRIAAKALRTLNKSARVKNASVRAGAGSGSKSPAGAASP